MAVWSPPDRAGRLEHCTPSVALCRVTVLACNWPSHPLIDITSPNTRPHHASLFLIAIPLLMECWFVMRGRWSLGSDPVCPSVRTFVVLAVYPPLRWGNASRVSASCKSGAGDHRMLYVVMQSFLLLPSPTPLPCCRRRPNQLAFLPQAITFLYPFKSETFYRHVHIYGTDFHTSAGWICNSLHMPSEEMYPVLEKLSQHW